MAEPMNSKTRPIANHSAMLLSELAEMARSHSRSTRSHYHGLNSPSKSPSSNFLKLSTTNSPEPSAYKASQSPSLSDLNPNSRSNTPTEFASDHHGKPVVSASPVTNSHASDTHFSDTHASNLHVVHTPSSATHSPTVTTPHSVATPYGCSPSDTSPLNVSPASTISHSPHSTVSSLHTPSNSSFSDFSKLGGVKGSDNLNHKETPLDGISSTVSSQDMTTVGQTDVDRMMLLLQAQNRKKTEVKAAAASSDHIFACPVSGCDKQFRQRAHLHTHARSHTGERPFECPFEGCHKLFSQRCNLRTHIRSHTGERPFKCRVCGREFSQQGNMRHHELIHGNTNPLICKLEGCHKSFNQLGNLKAHQNTTHKETVRHFMDKLQNGAAKTDFPPEDRELFDYFCSLYKNANRGIRGRGKGTKTIQHRFPYTRIHRDKQHPTPQPLTQGEPSPSQLPPMPMMQFPGPQVMPSGSIIPSSQSASHASPQPIQTLQQQHMQHIQHQQIPIRPMQRGPPPVMPHHVPMQAAQQLPNQVPNQVHNEMPNFQPMQIPYEGSMNFSMMPVYNYDRTFEKDPESTYFMPAQG